MFTFRELFGKRFPSGCKKAALRRRIPRLGVEQLEDRLVPAPLTVTSALDPTTLTAGTLRYAVQQANTDAAAGISDTILFNTGQMGSSTIPLQQGVLELKAGPGTTTINGASQVTLSDKTSSSIFQVDSGAQADLTGLTIQNGVTGIAVYGGDINNAGTLTASNDTLSGGFAGYGGGICNSGTLTVSNTTLAGNSAIYGGGIYNSGTLTVSNSTLSGNSADYGGGIYNTGTLVLSNGTVSGNSASFGGGLDNGGTVTLGDTIVAGNKCSASGTSPDISGSVVASSSYNLVGNRTGMTGMSTLYNNQIGTSSAPIDPLLAPLGNYGGPTQTMALLPGSPAAGAAVGVAVSSAITSPTATTIGVIGAAAIAITPGNYTIQVDAEQMLVTNVNPTTDTLTVVRGYNGTTAASHSILTPVYLTSDQRGVSLTMPAAMGAYQPQALASIMVSAPSTATAGTPFSVIITAKDSAGHGYTGPVTLAGSDGQTVSPATVTLINGTARVPVTLDIAHTLQLTASWGAIKSTGNSITVSPASVAAFAFSDYQYETAGVAFNVTVTAEDAYGNTVPSYNGTATLTYSDGQTVSPATVALIQGTGTANVVFDKADTITLTARAGWLQGTSNAIFVSGGAAVSLTISAPSAATAGVAFNVSFTGTDAFGNPASGFVYVTSSDHEVQAIASMYNGQVTDPVTLDIAHTVQITASSGSARVTSNSITVNPGPVASFKVKAPSSVTAGVGFTVAITATDAYGNPTSAHATFTTSDGQAVSPASVDVVNGRATANVTLDTADTVQLTVFHGTVSATSDSLTVYPGPLASFKVTAPGAVTAGAAFNVAVTATDAYGNIATGFSDPISLYTSDGQTVTPSYVNVINGVGSASVVLDRVDTLTLSVTALETTGTSSNITVTPAGPASFVVSAPSTVAVGSGFTVSITALDPYGNTATGYIGQVTLSSTDNQTVYGNSIAVNFGSGSGTVTLQLADVVCLTAHAGSISGTSNSILVTSDWFSRIPDPGLQAVARTDWYRDRAITYTDMMDLFSTAESESGTISTPVMQSLQVVVDNAGYLGMWGYVQNLANKVVNGDAENGFYRFLNSQGLSQTIPLGNLYAGCPSWQLTDLVNKWFLGEDYPSTALAGGFTPSYQLVTGVPLFASGPNYWVVHQVALADCWLLASVAEVADRDPAAIVSMFNNNGNGTYSVRFWHNGVADYVTVDGFLPNGGRAFDNITHLNPDGSTSTELWVALIEKAYAQENAEGWLSSNSPGLVSYQALNFTTASFGGTDYVISALANIFAKGSDIDSGNWASEWQAGKMIVLGTNNPPNNTIPGVNFVSQHVYAMVNYNGSGIFTVFNPWGLAGNFEGKTFCAGLITATTQALAPEFVYQTYAGSAPVANAGKSDAKAAFPTSSIVYPLAVSGSEGNLGELQQIPQNVLPHASQDGAELMQFGALAGNRIAVLDTVFAALASQQDANQTPEKTFGASEGLQSLYALRPVFEDLNDLFALVGASLRSAT